MLRLLSRSLPLLAVLCAATTLLAQGRLTVRARFEPATAAPGAEVKLIVEGDIEPGYHIYGVKDPSYPTKLVVKEAAGLQAKGAPSIPFGHPHESFGIQNFWVEESVQIEQAFIVPATATGKLEMAGVVDYMACTPEFCDPPSKAQWRAGLTIGGAAPVPAPAPAAVVAPAPTVMAPQGRLTITSRFEPAIAMPGSQIKLIVEAEVEVGYHIYGGGDPTYPTKLLVQEAAGLVATGSPTIPVGHPHESFGTRNFWVEDTAVLEQVFQVPATAAPGVLEVAGVVDHMACTPEFCDPPAKAKWRSKVAIAAGAAAPAAAPVPAPAVQDPTVPKPVPGLHLEFTPSFAPNPARPGEKVRLTLKVSIDEGYHVYGAAESNSIKPELQQLQTGVLRADGELVLPPGEAHGEGELATYNLYGTFEITQDFVVPADASPGTVELTAGLHYQVCDESSCEPLQTAPFSARLLVEAGAARPEHQGKAGPVVDGQGGGQAPATGPAEQDQEQLSLWQLLLECFLGGLLALAMPCTYPMIPITFSFFTKQAEKGAGNVLALALTYGFGIVLMFVVIGLAFGQVIIPFAGHWATNAVLAVAFVAFALSLFGLFTLQLPQGLQNLAGSAGRSGGVAGVFFMGATLVVSSFTCTGPVVALLLARAAQGRDLSGVAIGMAVFGLTMALPFVFLSLLPGRVKQLPRSGEWMNTLKVTLGFVEIAAALKFVSNVDIFFGWNALPRELFLVAYGAIFLLTAMFLFGLLRHRDEPFAGVGTGRLSTGLLFFVLAFYCLYGAMGFKLDFVMTSLAPPYSGQLVVGKAGGEADHGHEVVYDDPDAAIARAQDQGRLVLINFTGFA